MPLHHAEKEPSWPIELFRYTESLGWQKQVGAAGTGTAIRASPRKDWYVQDIYGGGARWFYWNPTKHSLVRPPFACCPYEKHRDPSTPPKV